ncbi:MAG: hypothetical protein CVU05_05470, partial [Bacteroidetes bacterium HGW-Bacteroidetes-21]
MEEKSKKIKPGKPKAFNIYWVYGAIFLLFIGMQFIDFGPKSKEIDLYKLQAMISAGDVDNIIIVNREVAEVFLKAEALKKPEYKDFAENGSMFAANKPQFFYTILSLDTFEGSIAAIQKDFSPEQRIKTKNETRKDYFVDILSWLLPLVIIVGLWIYFFRRMSGGGSGGNQVFNIGKSKAKLFDKETGVKVDFKDVAGLEGAKQEVVEIVEFLRNPKKYTELGGKIPKGALLVGPPGTGKTLLARAVAGEANVPFFSLSGSDFVEMFVGVGASRVRDLFKQAKEKAPCIVFIDEIDAIGRSRGKGSNFGGNDERENTLNQLLTEMDGFDSNSGVIILAAT